jgi:hypothetical protein
MHLYPALVLLGASAALGVWLGLQYLRRVRAKPALIAVHLMLGGAGLEAFAVLLRGTPDGDVMPAGWLGNSAGILLAMAMLSGLATPLIAKRRPRRTGSIALAVHVGAGLAGFALFVTWLARL